MRLAKTVPALVALLLAGAAVDSCAQGVDNGIPGAEGGGGRAPRTTTGIGGVAVVGTGGFVASGGTGGAPTSGPGAGGSGLGGGSGGTTGDDGGTTGGAAGLGASGGGNGGSGGVVGAGGSSGSGGMGGVAGKGGAGGSSGAGGSAGKGGAGGAGTATGGAGGTGGGGAGGTGGNGGKAGAGGAPIDAGIIVDAQPDRPILVHPICAVGACKLVFVSSSTVAGNAGSGAAIDNICQGLADARSFAGTYRAWLTDATGPASARITHATVPYRLLDGSTIANNYTDLTDNTLAHAIDVREDGTALAAQTEIWTGTMANGADGALTCSGWTSLAGTAIVGLSNLTTTEWSYSRQEFCNPPAPTPIPHVYCFEQ